MPITSPRPDPVEYTIAASGQHTTVAVILDGIHIVTSGQNQYTEVTTLLREADTTDTVVRARLLGLITGAIPPGGPAVGTAPGEAEQAEPASASHHCAELTEHSRITDGQFITDDWVMSGSLPELIVKVSAAGDEPARLAALVALAERLVSVPAEVAEHLWDWVIAQQAGLTTNGQILGYMAAVPGPVPGSYGVAVDNYRGTICGRVVGSTELSGLTTGPVATVLVDPADIAQVPAPESSTGLVVSKVQLVTITAAHLTASLSLDPARPSSRLGVQTLDLARLTSTPHRGGGGEGEDQDVPDDPDESDDHEAALCTECPCDCECDGGCGICRCCD